MGRRVKESTVGMPSALAATTGRERSMTRSFGRPTRLWAIFPAAPAYLFAGAEGAFRALDGGRSRSLESCLARGWGLVSGLLIGGSEGVATVLAGTRCLFVLNPGYNAWKFRVVLDSEAGPPQKDSKPD